jgi:hypothetical protein|tara:strand:+ start:43136 stop:43417 length:282 start_codon:yes stop_codon:yes gene_type:complete
MRLIIVLALIGYVIFRYSSDVDSDGYLKLDRYEKVDVDVYFYFQNSPQEYYLDTVTGTSNCGDVAYSYAYEKRVQSTRWSYICITTDGLHEIR